MRTLVLGGIRSGKSGYAEGLLDSASSVSYLATAAVRPDDAEWQRRLLAHQRRRPAHWHTHEYGHRPEALPDAVGEGPGKALLIDDLGGWVTALHDAAGWHGEPVAAPCHALTRALAKTPADSNVVLVSPETGLSLTPDNPVARRFADALGAVNQHVAEACDRVVMVIAGQPLWIKGGAAPNLP